MYKSGSSPDRRECQYLIVRHLPVVSREVEETYHDDGTTFQESL